MNKICTVLFVILVMSISMMNAAANSNNGVLVQINSTNWYFQTNQTNLADGIYTYYATANNTLGQETLIAQQTIIIDTTEPAIDFISPTDTNGTSVARNYTFVNTSVSDSGSPNNLTALINFDNSLVGWWRFNNNTGTLAEDFSGYGNNGTLTDMNTGLDNCTGNCSGWNSSGKFGNALAFDGVDDYVDAGNAASLNIIGNITIESWIFSKETAANYAGIVTKSATATSIETYALHQKGNGIRFSIYTNSVINLDSTGIDVRNTYHHVAGVYDGNTSYLYIDGKLNNFAAKTGSSATNTRTIKIGR